MACVRVVARFCRVMVRAEQPDATAALLAQVTVMEDRLGLTPKAMRLLLWHISDAEPEPAGPTSGKTTDNLLHLVAADKEEA